MSDQGEILSRELLKGRCPCGVTTGHGQACSGTNPTYWCGGCQQLKKMFDENMRLRRELRRMEGSLR